MSVTPTRTHARDRNRVVHRPAPRLRDEEGVRYGIAHLWVVISALLAGATSPPHPVSFTLLALAALLGGRGLALRWQLGIALAAWAIWTGFLENSLGVLTFAGSDVVRLVGLATLAAASAHLVRGRWVRLAP